MSNILAQVSKLAQVRQGRQQYAIYVVAFFGMLQNGAQIVPLASTLALAGTGVGGWALWLLQVAGHASRDPRVQEVVHEAGVRSLETVRDVSSRGMANAVEWADALDTSSGTICLGPWLFALLAIGVVCLVIAFVFAALCGCLVAGGSGWWFGSAHRNNHNRLAELKALDALARQALAGGPGAMRLAAVEADVEYEVMQEWCEVWVRAMRGPRR